jgi:hypothetical protein
LFIDDSAAAIRFNVNLINFQLPADCFPSAIEPLQIFHPFEKMKVFFAALAKTFATFAFEVCFAFSGRA